MYGILEAIKKYENIAVRDYHTQEVASKITSKKIERVVDPTLLFSKNYYLKLEKKMEQKQKYIHTSSPDNG